MEAVNQISIFVALGAGLLSFISPCVLPLFPAYLSFITGMSATALHDAAVIVVDLTLTTAVQSETNTSAPRIFLIAALFPVPTGPQRVPTNVRRAEL